MAVDQWIEVPAGVRGLVFDCDGTVADTMPLHYQAWVAALGGHGAEMSEAVFYELAGIPTEGIVAILNDRHGHAMDPAAVAEVKDGLFEEMIPQVTAIEPVVAIVRRYAGKLPMAVASGGTRALVGKTLSALGLLDCFAAVVTADDVRNGKPAPDIFLEAARRIGVPPEHCCGFEDAELGLQAVRAAGMVAVDIRPAYRAARNG